MAQWDTTWCADIWFI